MKQRETMISVDDKRFLVSSENIFVEREDEKELHFCPDCENEEPTFILTETFTDHNPPHLKGKSQRLRCCWNCGYGISIVSPLLRGGMR